MASPAQATSPPANPEAPDPPPTSPPRQQHEAQPEDEQKAPETLPPLFTLVQNSTSRTTHHPHVHYIFADDDPEVLTRALTASDPAASGGNDTTRSVLLDLAPGDDGWRVAHAASLSADWAVVDAGLRAMEGAEGQEGGAGGLMLRIEGVEGEGGGVEGEEGGRDGREEYGALVGEFERRMGVLRRVVEAGEARRRGLGEGAQGESPREAEEKVEGVEGAQGTEERDEKVERAQGAEDSDEKVERAQGAEERDEKDKGGREDQVQPGSAAGG